MDGQPVALQRRHDRGGVGVEPASRHRQQDQHRHEHEHPQGAVLRSPQHDRGGDQPREAGQVDELVHVAPRHPVGGQAAQHDADEQQRDAEVDQGQPGPADPLVGGATRGVADHAGAVAVGGDGAARRARQDEFALGDLAAAAVGQFDGQQQQRDDQDDHRRGERPVGVPGQPQVERARCSSDLLLRPRGRHRRDVGPASSRSVSRSNSSPQPELSVRAKPPSSTFTVPVMPRLRLAGHGVTRTQIRRRRITSDTSRPAIIVIANTSTQIWAGSWETCRLTNGVAPSNRTTRPVVEAYLLAGAQVDPVHLRQPALVDQPRIQREQRLRPPGVQSGVAAVDVDGHRGVVQRRVARRQQRAVELFGRRQQSLDGDLMLAAFVGVGVGARGRVDADHARRQQRHAGPPGATARSGCASARRGTSR